MHSPPWHYDVVRALDYFRVCGAPRDPRMQDAIDIIRARRCEDGRWILQNRYHGRTYFEMEKTGKPSRWNTLRALRMLVWWDSMLLGSDNMLPGSRRLRA